MKTISMWLKLGVMALVLVLSYVQAVAGVPEKDLPEKPNPPRLVNDFAHILTPEERDHLEHKLVTIAQMTSNQIVVVTVTDIGGYDVAEYTTSLFNKWGVGAAERKNGVVLLVAMTNHKSNITVGGGLQGVLTDATSGRLLRNELKPNFKDGKYYDGLSSTVDAINDVTKGEYKGDGPRHRSHSSKGPSAGIVILIIIIVIIATRRRGGGGGGNYMSRGGLGDFATGWFLGNLMSGGFGRGGGGGSDWGGGGDGGFGGFGGGSTDGGGASGDW